MPVEPSPLAPNKAALWTGRGLTLLVTLFLLFDGIGKVLMLEPVVSACVRLGIPENAIVGIGITLVVATLLYALPITTVLGAVLLTGYLGGAILTHVRVAGPGFPWFPVAFAATLGLLLWLGVCLREPRMWRMLPLRVSA